MIEMYQYMFSSTWVYFGTLVFTFIVLIGIAWIASVIKG